MEPTAGRAVYAGFFDLYRALYARLKDTMGSLARATEEPNR